MEPHEVQAALRPADFGSRFSAFMIDASLLFAAQWLVVIVLSRQLQAVGMTATEPCSQDPLRLCEGPSTALWVLLLVFLFATTIGYHAWFEGRFGATPGKRWMGLAVVDSEAADSDGFEPVGLARSGLRSVVRQSFWLSLFFLLDASPLSIGVPSFALVAIPALALVGVAVGTLRSDGRSLHDFAAGTVVTTSERLASPARDLNSSIENAEESV